MKQAVIRREEQTIGMGDVLGYKVADRTDKVVLVVVAVVPWESNQEKHERRFVWMWCAFISVAVHDIL